MIVTNSAHCAKKRKDKIMEMKRLNVAIIGQGRSGRDIHGKYFHSDANTYYNVKYVVEADEFRRNRALEEFEGCQVFESYTELFDLDDVDLVVNASYSEMHYPITKDLLLHGFNVLVEKPFSRLRYQCDELIEIAKQKGVTLAVFQQSFYAPYYKFTLEKIADGTLGDIKQINVRFNGFSRRWDWQTLQKKCAGGLYNTGPHPVGLALGYLDFADDAHVEFSRLGTALTSGDGDDYAKVILTAKNKPVVDVEVCSNDAYIDYNVKILGSRGTLKCKITEYEMTYIVDGENPERPVVEHFLEKLPHRTPAYCGEVLIKHVEADKFNGTAFDVGSSEFYKDLYFKITEGREMYATPEIAAKVIGVIETVHAQNPLPVRFI